MNKSKLENVKFKTGKGYLAAVSDDDSLTNWSGNQYYKMNSIPTKMKASDYFFSQTGYGDENYLNKLFPFEKISEFNFGHKSRLFCFAKLANSELGAMIPHSSIHNLFQIFQKKSRETMLLANVSSQPFVFADSNNTSLGLVFPVFPQWFDSENFYSATNIQIICEHKFLIKSKNKSKLKSSSLVPNC